MAKRFFFISTDEEVVVGLTTHAALTVFMCTVLVLCFAFLFGWGGGLDGTSRLQIPPHDRT